MYQIIGEDISIIGIYKGGHFLPKKMQWHQQTLPIDQICSIHDFKDGAVKKRRYSVMSGQTVYLIEYNRDQESWTLQQIYV